MSRNKPMPHEVQGTNLIEAHHEPEVIVSYDDDEEEDASIDPVSTQVAPVERA